MEPLLSVPQLAGDVPAAVGLLHGDDLDVGREGRVVLDVDVGGLGRDPGVAVPHGLRQARKGRQANQ